MALGLMVTDTIEESTLKSTEYHTKKLMLLDFLWNFFEKSRPPAYQGELAYTLKQDAK